MGDSSMKNDLIITLKDLLKKREIDIDCALDTATLYHLAEEFGLQKIDFLKTNFNLTLIAQQKGIALKADIKALVIHECVVTLGPVPQSINENILIRFTPDGEDDVLDQFSDTVTSSDAKNMHYDIEILENNQVNLYDVIREYVSLALYTNPRVANAHFDGFTVGDITNDELVHVRKNLDRITKGQAPVANNPFSALASLKEKIQS